MNPFIRPLPESMKLSYRRKVAGDYFISKLKRGDIVRIQRPGRFEVKDGNLFFTDPVEIRANIEVAHEWSKCNWNGFLEE